MPPDLEAKLNRLAAESGRNVHQLALDLLTNSIEYDERFQQLMFLEKIDAGLTQLDAGKAIPHDEVKQRFGL